MQKFCPQCGAPVSQGTFCDACSEHEKPEDQQITLCPTRRYQYNGSWTGYDEPHEIIDDIVSTAAKGSRVRHVSHNLDRLRHDVGTTHEVIIFIEEDGVDKEINVAVDVNESPARKRQHSSYKAATVQIRDMDDNAQAFLHDALRSLPGDSSLNRVEDAENGVDLGFGRTGEAKSFAQRLCDELGGAWTGTRTHHTVDSNTSKKVYRSTYAVRLVPFTSGDVIEYEGVPHFVRGVGRRIKLTDLTRNASFTVDAESLLSVQTYTKHKVTVSTTHPSLTVLHPETYQSVDAANPYGFAIEDGQTVTVVMNDTAIIVND